MKTMKLTAALFAILATAAFNTSANATAANGDLIFGIYDTGSSPNSFEIDLGLASKFLTASANNTTLTFNLGSDISSIFGSSVGSNLVFGAAATGGSGSTGAGGLAQRETLITVPDGAGNFVQPSSNNSENTAISALVGPFNAPANQTTFGDNSSSVPNGTAGSFKNEVVPNHNFAYGSGAANGVVQPYSNSSLEDLFLVPNGAGNGAPSDLGTFSFNTSTGVLTFAPTAVPEPSTYALMAAGFLAFFWMLKRRQSVI